MKKLFLFITGIIIACILISFFVMPSLIKSPEENMNQLRKKLANAQQLNSKNYAPAHYREAKNYYDSAMMAWQEENERFFIVRNYTKTAYYINQSNCLFNEATKNSKDSMALLNEALKKRIGLIEKNAQLVENAINTLPINRIDREELQKCFLLINEGKLNYEQKNYISSKGNLDDAEFIVHRINNSYNKRLEAFYGSYNNWQLWFNQAIKKSKKNKTGCIVIDKFARECYLYKNGLLNKTFNVELGLNWMGDKNYAGDKKTPEGIYKIVKKKSDGLTKYHKALLLNYPNEEDKNRFVLNKKSGVIDKTANIGNLIEIHGNGGFGFDWTDGCIALHNDDMDRLFTHCSVGTPVIIVGSLQPIKYINLKNS